MKLSLVVFSEPTDIFSASIVAEVYKDFDIAFRNDYDEKTDSLPRFTIKWFYQKKVGWFEYKGDYFVFCSSRLTQQELGRVEHCIYSLTGRRGVGNHIDKLEFLGSPNVPMKKFLLKRF